MADASADIIRNNGTDVVANPEALDFTTGLEVTDNGGIATIKVKNDGIDNAQIKDDAVSLEHLDDGVLPSHVIKFSGTTGAYGGGGTSNAFTVTGAASTDVASAVIRASTNAVSIVKAVLTTNTLTVHFSADPGASTTVDYIIVRTAA